MAKKKRQSDPQDGSDSSTESGNEKNQGVNKGGCQHMKKAVDLNGIKKAVKLSKVNAEKCNECLKSNSSIAAQQDQQDQQKLEENGDFEYDRTLWMCLKCGACNCGRTVNKHALKHYETPRSESHSMAVNTETSEIWCYDCDQMIEKLQPKLQQCIDFIKNHVINKTVGSATITTKENGELRIENVPEKIRATVDTMRPLLGNAINIVNSLNTNQVDQLPRVRGLSNLGNTCFFNAVMQCLAQTPYLLPVLKQLSEPNEEFELPGGKILFKNEEEETILPPIKGKLLAWNALTKVLAETLEELQKSGGVYNPRPLFNQLTKKWPQFDGGDQHDSHELLRHLLESVKNEDMQRYYKVILEFFKYKKAEHHLVPDEMKQKCKFYGNQASERILCPEKVFRGFLVSTLTCQDCQHTSSRHENFLDLSLPVSVEKPPPPIRRKGSPDELSTSKDLAQRDKQKSKSNERNKKQHQQHQSETEESDADVEDNLSEDVANCSTAAGSNGKRGANRHSIKVDANGNTELCERSPEKRDDSPETTNKDDLEGSCESKRNAPSLVNNQVFELGISAKGGQELAQKLSHEDDVSGTGDGIGAIVAAKSDSYVVDGLQALSLTDMQRKCTKKKRKRYYSHTDWSSTIAPRIQCSEGECSIQSCLNNFTALELMTGNNKVCCASCSERINGKDGKTINTNATKQFFISSPPAVLILHLKRFQVGPRCMSRKLSKHVTYPFVLDLASFCASKVKTLPNVNRSQKKLIYSLYGIVEHSGSMHGGHYVAYVKVRPKLSPDDPRWKFLPEGSKAELDQADEQKVQLDKAIEKDRLKEMRLTTGDSDDSTSASSASDEDGRQKATTATSTATGGCSIKTEAPEIPTPPDGKWYYVSDSHVSEVNEERVLDAQAYLLFYERIY